VVGAIASLALLFIQHTVIGKSGVDWAAIALMLLAAFALFKLQWGIVRVIALCAVFGLLRSFVYL
jgi:chromate transporter